MRSITVLIISVVAVSTFAAEAKHAKVLWNEESPCSFAEKPKDVQDQADELTEEMDRGFKEMLKWHGGQKIVDPNEKLKEEIAALEKVLGEVFRPDTIPFDEISSHLLQTNITVSGKPEQVLMVRFKTDDYVIKLVKREYSLRVVARPSSGKAISSEELAKRLFTERILPQEWDTSFSYIAKLWRPYKSFRIGGWLAKDFRYYDIDGNIHEAGERLARPEVEPIGHGVYRQVAFCTDAKFTCFAISSGPKKP